MKTYRTHIWATTVLSVALSGLSSQASVILSIDSATQIAHDTSYDLTALGEVDWYYWESGGDNSKNGGTAIQTEAITGGGSLFKSGSTDTAVDFSFSDGVSPASGPFDNPSGVENNDFDQINSGVTFDIILTDPDSLYKVNVWGTGYLADQATLTAALSSTSDSFANVTGALAYSDGSGTLKDVWLYTLSARPALANDALSITLVLTEDGAGALSRVGFAGVAISTVLVPEPTTLSMLLAGFGLIGAIRRRKKHQHIAAA